MYIYIYIYCFIYILITLLFLLLLVIYLLIFERHIMNREAVKLLYIITAGKNLLLLNSPEV